MRRFENASIFWSKDESDADSTSMAQMQRSSHVPGVTDTAMSRKKRTDARTQLSLQDQQRALLKRGQQRRQKGSSPRDQSKKVSPVQKERSSSVKEAPSLKDLKPEDKKRVANLVRELAKIGEEKEVAVVQLQVERKENELKNRELQGQLAAILKERQNIQQQYLDCQKLLADYQARTSEDHQSLATTPTKKDIALNTSWSPIKESTQHPPSFDSHQSFVQLHPVPDDSNQPTNKNPHSDVPLKEIDRDSFHAQRESHDLSRSGQDQFKPVLSSTHRPHHQTRVPSNGMPEPNGETRRHLMNGNSTSSGRMFELSPSVASAARKSGHQVAREVSSSRRGVHETSRRDSSDAFMPLPEETDYTQSSKATTRDGRGERGYPAHRSSLETQTWASIPETNRYIPSIHETQERIYEPRKESGLRPQFRESGQMDSHPGFESQQEWKDNRSLTPEQRQGQLGSMRERLQHTQDWLQHKLQEQELLLHQKQLEIQIQKLHLSSLSDPPAGSVAMQEEEMEYAGLRKKYVDDHRGDIYHGSDRGASARGVIHEQQRKSHPDGQGQEMNLAVNGSDRWPYEKHRDHDELPWKQHHGAGVMPQASIRYPQDDPEPSHGRTVPQGRRNIQPHLQPQERRYYDDHLGHEELEVDDYAPADDNDEEEPDEMWIEMRGQTEVADERRRNIQGYASLHPHTYQGPPGAEGRAVKGSAKKPVITESTTSPTYQSYHIPDTTDDHGYPQEYIPGSTNKQVGNITAFLEAEELETLSSSGANRSYIPPQYHPRHPNTNGAPHGGAGMTPHPHRTHIPNAHPFEQQGRVGTHSAAGMPMSSSFGARRSDASKQGGVAQQLPASSHRGSYGYEPHPNRPHQSLLHPNQRHQTHPHSNGLHQSLPHPKGPYQSLPHPNQRHQTHPHPNRPNQSLPHPGSKTRPSALHRRPPDVSLSHDGPATDDDALHSNLVQRSHRVIREIGALLQEEPEVGEEEESQLLHDIFFLQR